MSDKPEETLLEFPCRFPIKMMGRDGDNFRQVAVDLVELHTGKIPEDSITESMSSKGNFLSITVTIDAESQQQLDNIYQALCDHEEILVAL
ncbi:MAG: YbeD family protein [Woeseiaceae bacterium]